MRGVVPTIEGALGLGKELYKGWFCYDTGASGTGAFAIKNSARSTISSVTLPVLSHARVGGVRQRTEAFSIGACCRKETSAFDAGTSNRARRIGWAAKCCRTIARHGCREAVRIASRTIKRTRDLSPGSSSLRDLPNRMDSNAGQILLAAGATTAAALRGRRPVGLSQARRRNANSTHVSSRTFWLIPVLCLASLRLDHLLVPILVDELHGRGLPPGQDLDMRWI